MVYELSATEGGTEVQISANSREDLFREAVAAALEMLYGAPPEAPETEGQVVPLQAAGDDDASLLSGILAACLGEAPAGNRLLPVRWLAFDANRVTVTLPRSTSVQTPHAVTLQDVNAGPSPNQARLLFAAAAQH